MALATRGVAEAVTSLTRIREAIRPGQSGLRRESKLATPG
jgi:hypothetical protein